MERAVLQGEANGHVLPPGFTVAADPEQSVDVGLILPWLIATGETYFRHYFGSLEAAEKHLRERLHKRDAEFWTGRCRVLRHEDHGPVGGYYLLTGAELPNVRNTEVIRWMRKLDGAQRASLSDFLVKVHDLNAPVPQDAVYISGIGLLDAFRGRGFGRVLLDACIGEASRSGASILQLNVDPQNTPARRLYEAAGLSVFWSGSAPEFDLHSESMRMDLTS